MTFRKEFYRGNKKIGDNWVVNFFVRATVRKILAKKIILEIENQQK